MRIGCFFFYIKRKGSSIKCFPICHPLQYSYPRKQTQRYITTSWLIMEKHTHIHTLSPSCSCNHLTKITVQGNLSGKRAALTSRSTSCKRESNRFPNKLTTLLMLTLRKWLQRIDPGKNFKRNRSKSFGRLSSSLKQESNESWNILSFCTKKQSVQREWKREREMYREIL